MNDPKQAIQSMTTNPRKPFFHNYLPYENLLGWFKLKEFEDNNVNVPQNLKIVLASLQKIVGKGENAG